MGYRLSWRDNGDGLDVAVLANRAARRGIAVHWCRTAASDFEAGDYSLALAGPAARHLADADFRLHPADGEPPGAKRLAHPGTALLCGEVSAYPYFGFYTLCLFRLGLAYRPVSGADIAAGAVRDRTLLVLPGGFATWGLDAGEAAPGADAEVRSFMDAGGGCIGSCGGAFYLSAGRPGWTGSVPVVPRWTHEYLQSGAAVVRVQMPDDPLRTGLPPTLELPYYHGPVYEPSDLESLVHGAGDNTLAAAGYFRGPCLPSRLMIDNPLEAERFERSHAGRVAIVRADGLRGRAVLFSPHPEMGDLMRKYMALDGYVRHYLPVRGEKTMEETLRFYRPLESPAFRLVNNAVHWLDAGQPPGRATPGIAVPAVNPEHMLRTARSHLNKREPEPEAGMERLMDAEAQRLEQRLAAALERMCACMDRAEPELAGAWQHAAGEAVRTMSAALPPQEGSRVLFDVDLLGSITEAAARIVEIDTLLDAPGPGR